MAQLKNEALIKKIALRLKDLRTEHNMSQEQVYNETNVHVARIETGRLNISVSTLSVLCDFYGLTLTEFFKKIEK